LKETKPKRSRRKAARPAEIVAAALETFAERGFADTKLDEVARRAGIAKGTLFLYFDSKDALFRAVVRQALISQLEGLEAAGATFKGSLTDFVPLLLKRAAQRMGEDRLPAIARMVFTESRAFPDLARVWHDEVLARLMGLVAGVIAQGQSRGEVRPGDPNLYAFSIMGPMVAAVLFHEVFGSETPAAPDLEKLAAQHAETVLRGLLTGH
jgi:AcrR family transcriptional regulator